MNKETINSEIEKTITSPESNVKAVVKKKEKNLFLTKKEPSQKKNIIADDANPTLYPKGREWTIKELNALTAEDDKRTLAEGGGLRGRVGVRVSGAVSIYFTYRYRDLNGKTKDYSCGVFPKFSIKKIRETRDAARVLVAQGVDPAKKEQATRIENQAAIAKTLEEEKKKKIDALLVTDLFEQWVTLPSGVLRNDDNATLRRAFNKDVLPIIGNVKISNLTADDILRMLKAIKDRARVKNDPQRGLNRTIDIIYNDIGQMLRWGEKRQPWRRLMIEGNPIDLVTADHVARIQDEGYKEVRERILNDDEIRELKSIFLALEVDYANLPSGQKYSGIRPVNNRIQCAVWLCLSTMSRIGELLLSRWEHIDLDAGIWFIPAANTKGRRGQRRDHYVTLSSFAITQFKLLKSETGHTDFCFPSRDEQSHVCLKTVSKQIGDRQSSFKNRTKPLSGRHNDDSLVLSAGCNGAWTPHDLRRTGATMMQKLGIAPDIIDRCQNHVIETKNKSAKHYQLYDYANEKAEAWYALGDYLGELLNNSNVA